MNKIKMICTRCGHMDKPVTVTPGDCLTELVLWILLLIPGLILFCLEAGIQA